MLLKATFHLSWITTVKYYSCTVPNLALACSDKTLYVFCMEMEQVFEMKVKEKVQKLKDSEAEVINLIFPPLIDKYSFLK